MRSINDPLFVTTLFKRNKKSWKQRRKIIQNSLPSADLFSFLESLVPEIPAVIKALETPSTLLHADLWLHNLLLGTKEHPAFAVLDWQTMCFGNPLYDVATISLLLAQWSSDIEESICWTR